MTLFMRKTVIAVKKETTYGTDSTPTGAEAFLVKNATLTPIAGDSAARDLIRPYFGNSETIQLNSHAELKFDVEFQSSGTAGTAPAFKDALKACGFAETVTAGSKVEYLPVSASFDSVTIDFYLDGVMHQLTGARGTVSLSVQRGQIPSLSFSFWGRYNTPTDAALISPTYSGFKTPIGPNSTNTPTVTLHSAALVMESLSLDVANNMVFRDLPGGSSAALITDRKPTGSISFEAGLIATKNWFEIAKATTLGALQVVHGTAAGYICQIDAPNVQIQQPAYADSDGIAMINTNLALIPGSSGNDELKLTFK
jgi:hypothetical protein